MQRPETVRSESVIQNVTSTPHVWLVTGYRAGERGQILALAEALGWPFDIKELSYRKIEFRTSLFRGSDLRGIRLQDSSALEPPWPDLVISGGMRNEPVGRWIREQSGGRTRLVHIGRPWANPDQFDLVITTPQYRLPERDNVLHNAMTLHRVSAERLKAEAGHWGSRFMHLPKPYTGVIVGGNSGPYTLGAKAAESIARQASRMAGQRHGALLISTSARTPNSVVQVLKQTVSVPYYLYHWQANDVANPYFGILALSDELIVTADSVSMLSEACATGKPVYMAELGGYRYPMRPGRKTVVDFRLSALTYSWMMRFGPKRLSRDICLVHNRLLSEGRAAWLGESLQQRTDTSSSDMDHALQRVRALFGYPYQINECAG
ncbi:MAG: mitochondrial fission ELM1 family protein [Thiogranum sp.]